MESLTKTEQVVRGIIKNDLIKRMENQLNPFPHKWRICEIGICRYILKKDIPINGKYDHLESWQQNILWQGKDFHKKETARIRKAFRTIEARFFDEYKGTKDPNAVKILNFILLMWLKDEFYISKRKITDFISSFSIFFPKMMSK